MSNWPRWRTCQHNSPSKYSPGADFVFDTLDGECWLYIHAFIRLNGLAEVWGELDKNYNISTNTIKVRTYSSTRKQISLIKTYALTPKKVRVGCQFQLLSNATSSFKAYFATDISVQDVHCVTDSLDLQDPRHGARPDLAPVQSLMRRCTARVNHLGCWVLKAAIRCR